MELLTEDEYRGETLQSPDIVEAQLKDSEDETGSRKPLGFPIPALSNFVDLGDLLLDVAELDESVFE